MIKSFISAVAVLLVLGACQSQAEKGVKKIEAAELQQLQSDGVTVVDIRTPAEYSKGHIANVMHTDYMEGSFWEKIDQLPKDEPLVIYCASGGRSGKAAREMIKAGFVSVYDYSGGMVDWYKRKLPVEK